MRKNATKIIVALMAICFAYPALAKDAKVSSEIGAGSVIIKIKADKLIKGVAISYGESKETAMMSKIIGKVQTKIDLKGKLDQSSNKIYPIFMADTNELTCELTGLSSASDCTLYYQIEDSKELGKYYFSIPAPAPTKQASSLAFKEVNENTIPTVFNSGNGDGRIVVVKKGAGNVDVPKNGVEYKGNGQYGVASSKIGDSYVVYAGKGNQVDITNLSSGKQTIQVFEYNGFGKNISYNFEKLPGNARTKSTLLQTPKMNEAKQITESGFTISWEKVDGTDTYFIDVAYDPNFKEFAGIFKNADIGNITLFEVADLEKSKDYYVRVRAENVETQSAYSKTMMITPKR